jgi:excisionase family DNA binding protein
MSTTPHPIRQQLDLFGENRRIDPTKTKRCTRAPDKPSSISVNEALARYGIGRTKLYELLGDGSLKARRLGAKTLIDFETADDFFASLPSFRQS